MGATMSTGLSAKRILLGVVAATGVATLCLYITRPQQSLPPQIADSWLPLPQASMDARKLTVRRLLLVAMEAEQSTSPPETPWQSLAMTCGEGGESEPAERYTAVIGDWSLADDPQLWRVRMDPHGSTMWVKVEDLALSSASLREAGSVVPPAYTYVLPLEHFADLRDAWSAPAIWAEATEWRRCSDGRPAFFEACVRGKYVASRRACGEGEASAQAVERLWGAFQASLPAPPGRPGKSAD